MQGGPHHPLAHCKIDIPVDMRPVQGMQAWRAQAGTAGSLDTKLNLHNNYLQQTG